MLASTHSIWSGHTGRYLKDADQYTLPQNVLYFSVCLIGGGLVVLPYISIILSLPVVIGSLVILAATSCYTHSIVIEMADDNDLTTLEDISERAFGQIGYYFTWLLEFSFTLISAIVNLSAAAQLVGFYLKRDIDFSSPKKSVGRLYVVVMVAAPSLLITLVRMPRKMVVFHFVTLCAALGTGGLLIAMLVSELKFKEVATHASCWIPPKSVDSDYLEAIMLLSFCFVGHHKSLDAFNQLRLREESGRWRRVVSRSVSVVFIVYMIGVAVSLVCSNKPSDTCSSVANHRLFELFFAVVLTLIVPSDMRTLRRLLARLLARHLSESMSLAGRKTEQGNLVVFSQDGHPTLHGMNLGDHHFTVGGVDSGSEVSSESKSLEKIPPILNSMILGDDDDQGLESGLLDDVPCDEDRNSDDCISAPYEPPVIEPIDQDQNTLMEEAENKRIDSSIPILVENKEDEAVIEPYIEESLDVTEEVEEDASDFDSTRGSEWSQGSESVTTSSAPSSRSSLNNPKRKTVSKIRKGVARTTGAHGFFSRSNSKASTPATPSGDSDCSGTVSIGEIEPEDSENKGTLPVEADADNEEDGEDITECLSLVTALDDNEEHKSEGNPTSLLPPQLQSPRQFRDTKSNSNLEPSWRSSPLNQSWPNPYVRSQSESAVGVNRFGRKDVGAWAFTDRPTFNQNETAAENDEEESHRLDRDLEIISNISDGDDIAESEPFGCSAFQQFPATLSIWLLIVACAWITNFYEAVVLMTYLGGFGAAVLSLVLPATCYFKLAPLSSDFSAVVKFGTVQNQHLMPLVLVLGLSFMVTKAGLVVTCSLFDSDWCFETSDVSFFNQGSDDCF